MKDLIDYLNSLKPEQQREFALRCGTTIGYLRKAVSVNQRLGAGLVINLERESDGAVPCESMRPDVDWAYLRRNNDGALAKVLAVGEGA